MQRSTFLRLATASALSLPTLGHSEEAKAIPADISAEEIIQLIHRSRAVSGDNIVRGEIVSRDASHPFTMTLKADLFRFNFDSPKQIITLDITEKGARLRETTAGNNKEVPSSLYSTGIRGSDLNYDDMSMRYLYWPSKTKIGEETLKTRRCFVVDLKNPARLGDYYLVRVFVDRETGGMMRMQAYDWTGKLIKVCAVTSGMKLANGATMLKNMDITRYAPGTKKVLGETSLELHKS
jgi:hypothetical protein